MKICEQTPEEDFESSQEKEEEDEDFEIEIFVTFIYQNGVVEFERVITDVQIKNFLKYYPFNQHYYDSTRLGSKLKVPIGENPKKYFRIYNLYTSSSHPDQTERLILGRQGEIWYTPDHYDSIFEIGKYS